MIEPVAGTMWFRRLDPASGQPRSDPGESSYAGPLVTEHVSRA